MLILYSVATWCLDASLGPTPGAPLPGKNKEALLKSLPPNHEILEGKQSAISIHTRTGKENALRRRNKTYLDDDNEIKEALEKV
ncbi:putative chronic lymphocytic leukemia up-regulated protein 1 opposite strand transcript protein [Otolemur garnettii]|uniref:putative chronic lymphocytic leukemia up-regulated protein 1 opposite strand transcript protein n=1 Tax=Otolemur garnettii TaxID=30611 RepID=UPI000C7F0F65|nr:putative chronic lymphocytic leukemia up-regulated protein 1 opposite strand transcript protein [Otolemur garnettii]